MFRVCATRHVVVTLQHQTSGLSTIHSLITMRGRILLSRDPAVPGAIHPRAR
jgi:hypothetical protein